MALSDNGILVVGFQFQNYGLVEVYDTFVATSRPIYAQVWIADYGKGVAITPDASTVVVGSPKEGSVYVYEFSRRRFVLRNKVSNRGIPSFGWKVNISDSGQTLAVSAPQARNIDGLNVGAIVVYNYFNKELVAIDDFAYGGSEDRKLGLGGVAIDEKTGRVHGMDQNGIIDTYQVRTIVISLSFNDLKLKLIIFPIVRKGMFRYFCNACWN